MRLSWPKGCRPLASVWIQRFCYHPSSTNAKNLSAGGIHPIIGDVTTADGLPEAIRDLPEVDTVLWAVGFDRSAHASYRDVHVNGLLRTLQQIPNKPRVVFISSTGVWGEETNEVDESTPASPTREAGVVLLEAETLSGAIQRGRALFFGSLASTDLAGCRLSDIQENKPIAADPDSWLNLIHVDDAASVICDISELPAPKSLYIVSDTTPIRREHWYSSLAELTNSPRPRWATNSRLRGGNKRVNSDHVCATQRNNPNTQIRLML